MASFYRVVFSGSSDTIPVPFPYLDKSYVEVRLDDVLLSSSDYTWPSSGQVKITAGNPSAGVVGEVRRKTPTTPLVSFQPGNLDPSDLDAASVQAIHLAEEAKDDTADIVDRAWYTSNFQTGGTITKAAAGVVPMFNTDGDLVAGPSASQVAAAQGYAEAAAESAEQAATFDPSNFYTKTEADGALSQKADTAGDNAFSGENTFSEVTSFSKIVKWAKGADVASAAALTLGDDGNYFDVTGTTAITSIATVGGCPVIKLHFDGVLTLTHHTTNLVLPYGVDISTYAGLELEFVEYDVGKWRCTSHLQPPIFHVRDQKSTGTQGGASISGTQVRTLNTVVVNGISGAGLSANIVTLPAGTYDVEISCPAIKTDNHRAVLRLSGGGAIQLLGSQAYSGAADTTQTVSVIKGRMTLGATTTLEVAHYTSAVYTNGLGATVSDSQPSLFTEALFRKVA